MTATTAVVEAPVGAGLSQVFGASETGVREAEINVNAPHYVWIALHDVFIGARNQSSGYLGEIPGEVLPGKTPVRIVPTVARQPYEIAATAIDTEGAARTVSPLPFVDRHPNSQVTHNTAAALVDFLCREHEQYGIANLTELRGADSDEVKAIFDEIFDPEYFAELRKAGQHIRVIRNMRFEGVFLDQIREYLRKHAFSIVSRYEGDAAARALMSGVVAKVQAAVDSAWRFANQTLDDTESAIRAFRMGQAGKSDYGLPDHRFPNPIPPLDLVALAETNRVPIELQDKVMADEKQAASTRSLVEAFTAVQNASSAPVAGMSRDDVAALLAQQAEEYERKMAAAIQAAVDRTLALAEKAKVPEPEKAADTPSTKQEK